MKGKMIFDINNIPGDSAVRNEHLEYIKVFHIFTKFLMTTTLQVFVFIRVTVNAPLVRASGI